jgi:tRNA-dihydrouridine synthase A
MLGREAYHNPYVLSAMDARYFNDAHVILSRIEVIENMLPYIAEQRANDIFLKHITRHLLGLFHAQPGARQWRRYLTEQAIKHEAGIEVLQTAMHLIHQGGDH